MFIYLIAAPQRFRPNPKHGLDIYPHIVSPVSCNSGSTSDFREGVGDGLELSSINFVLEPAERLPDKTEPGLEGGREGGCDPSRLRGVTRREGMGEASRGAGGLSIGSAGEADFLQKLNKHWLKDILVKSEAFDQNVGKNASSPNQSFYKS